jgi:glycosyltransferase involved in cell wall biosynthesis
VRYAILGSRGFPSTYGGFETMVRHLAPFLRDAGHDVTVYCRGETAGRTSHLGIEQVTTRGVEAKSLSTLSFGLTSHIHAAFQDFDAALIVNCANGLFLPALRAAGVPTAVNTDGLEWERGKWGRVASSVFKAGAWTTARLADAVVADSTVIADYWQRVYQRSSAFIPYGAPVLAARDPQGIEKLGLKAGGYALVVARLVPENNVLMALKAFSAAPHVPLVVVGSSNYDNEESRLLAELTEKHPDRFIGLGHVSDSELLDDLWALASVYIHGHSAGGTNPALLQAMGAGAPVVAMDTGYNREVLGDGNFYTDQSSLLAAVQHLQLDDVARACAVSKARERIRTSYQWTDVCAEYARLLADLASGEEPSIPASRL